MVITSSKNIPSDDDLTVQDVNVSGIVLRAAAFHLGKYCEGVNNEFMLCRQETKDVRKCLGEGRNVTQCSLEFFQRVKASCSREFTDYYNCMDKSSPTYELDPCRKTQKIFDQCMMNSMNLERPHYGYFCEVKIHDSPRPKPTNDLPVYADTPETVHKDAPRPPGKYGSRNIFF